jgi:hypothetical protein
MDWMTAVQFLAGQDFSLHHIIQTGSETHRFFCPVGTRILSSGIKQPENETNHSPPPSSAEVKNTWSYTPFSHMSAWRGAWLSINTLPFK